MAEEDTSWHAFKGPKLETLPCREKLYILLSHFFASKEIAAHCDDEIGCPFRSMLDEFEDSRITQLLIETAVLVRMKDDLFQQMHGVDAETEKDIVGEFFDPATATASTSLNLRQACNKIIHAERINFNVSGEEERGFHARYVNPIVYLYGTNRGQRWRAVLNVVKWVEPGYFMFP